MRKTCDAKGAERIASQPGEGSPAEEDREPSMEDLRRFLRLQQKAARVFGR